MRYNPFTDFDKFGCLKPPLELYLCLVFLLRSYIMWIAALSFRQDSQRLLSLFYPDKVNFGVALVVALPALFLAGIISFRRPGLPKYIQSCWSHLPKILIFSASAQLVVLWLWVPQLQSFNSIAVFVTEVAILIAVIIFSLKNTRLRDAIRDFPQEEV